MIYVVKFNKKFVDIFYFVCCLHYQYSRCYYLRVCYNHVN